ncbi:MAG: thermonuclease family protein [Thermodesulfobacteriota bacterium]
MLGCRWFCWWRGVVAVAVCWVVLVANGVGAAQSEFAAPVRWVPDGDTIILEDRTTIRLQGIDAPETSHDETPAQYYAAQAQRALQEYVQQGLRFEAADEQSDRYGRVLALGYTADDTLVNAELVRRGRAFFYPHSHQDSQLQARLLQAQREALQERRGFWPRILDLPQANAPYLGNTSSSRFHRMDCPFGQKTSQDNRRRFDSLYEAFYAGFAPCRRCTVWPEK